MEALFNIIATIFQWAFIAITVFIVVAFITTAIGAYWENNK